MHKPTTPYPKPTLKHLHFLFLHLAMLHRADALDDKCKACLAEQHDAAHAPKAWCYATHSCWDVNLTLFENCPDFSLDPSSCQCRPSVYTDCKQCASLQHMGCVWMDNASVAQNVSFKLGPIPPATVNHNSYWKRGRCISGSGFSPFGLETEDSFVFGGGAVQVNYTSLVVPTQWYWGQCSLTGPAMAGSLLGGFCGLGMLCLLGCCCCAKRRRAHKRLVLLHEQGREPVPLIIGN